MARDLRGLGAAGVAALGMVAAALVTVRCALVPGSNARDAAVDAGASRVDAGRDAGARAAHPTPASAGARPPPPAPAAVAHATAGSVPPSSSSAALPIARPDGDALAPLETAIDDVLGLGGVVEVGAAVAVVARADHGSHTFALVEIDEVSLFLAALARRDGASAMRAMAVRMDETEASSSDEVRAERMSALLSTTGLPEAPIAASAYAGPEHTLEWRVVDLRRSRAVGGAERVTLVGQATIVNGLMSPKVVSSDCTARTELRLRDVDRDGELEVTAIVAGVATDVEDGATERECVVRAAILGAEGLAPQLELERERRTGREDVWTELHDDVVRTWRFTDADGDGHPDVRVTEVATGSTYDAPDDCDPDEPPTPAHRERSRSRTTWLCPWSAERDAWACPPDARLESRRSPRE